MNSFFSWEQDDNENRIPMYMPQAKAKPLGAQSIGLMQRSPSAPTQPPPMQSGGGVRPIQQPPQAGGGSGGSKKPAQDDSQITRPSSTYQPDYTSHDTPNTMDPFNPGNYEYNQSTGEFESKIPDPFDPKNYEWDSATGGPKYVGDSVWNPDHYQGTLYDPSNPFDLTEQEWVKMTGLMNSGSLLEEGLGLSQNADLIGGLSDMGGVADEIVGIGADSGFLDTLNGAWQKVSDYMPLIGLGMSVYNMTQDGVTPTNAMALGTSALAAAAAAAGSSLGPWGLLPAAPLIIGTALKKDPSREYFDPSYGMDLGDGRYLMLGNQSSKLENVEYDDVNAENFWKNTSGDGQSWDIVYDSNTNSFSRLDPYSLYDQVSMGSLDPESYARDIYNNAQGMNEALSGFGGGTDDRTYEQILEEVKNSGVYTPSSDDIADMAGMGGDNTPPEWQLAAGARDLFNRGLMSEDTVRQHALDAIENNRMTALQYGNFKGDPAVVNYNKKYPVMLSSLQNAYQQLAKQYGWGVQSNV